MTRYKNPTQNSQNFIEERTAMPQPLHNHPFLKHRFHIFALLITAVVWFPFVKDGRDAALYIIFVVSSSLAVYLLLGEDGR